ncbi:mitochondrial carrier [Nadsonia fulvescens var. elongata DSM 6958]|uniref:Putative mitochondrial carrier protein PET8 n=1 Tax=Nadsonia fulvescens var. elongata DSM 6958 TaxID=857566 RepID=A0A1E3PPA6_9ASCO|nr:mitochondrial carrier [Nadsonia fulvescens var. elongata DSM 6958]
MENNQVLISLIGGAVAGTSTDLFFFPIDTLKTRLQAKGGFFHNGGWKGVYRGVGSAIIASAPGASLFFVSYDTCKTLLLPKIKTYIKSEELAQGLTHMASASIGEVAACSVRVPAEVIKQRAQASKYPSSMAAFNSVLANVTGEGVFRGFYRGYSTTIMREIPFTMIQFPLYEYMKRSIAAKTGREKVTPKEGAVCGSIAGGIAAAITTPLDVIKTRLMLHETRIPIMQLTKALIEEEGGKALFKGIGPRVMWISMGGAIFLGTYETVKDIITPIMR